MASRGGGEANLIPILSGFPSSPDKSLAVQISLLHTLIVDFHFVLLVMTITEIMLALCFNLLLVVLLFSCDFIVLVCFNVKLFCSEFFIGKEGHEIFI